MLGGLAAANAGGRKVFLIEGDATGLHAAGKLLDLLLALRLAAPHGLDKAGMVFCVIRKLLPGGGDVGLGLHVLLDAVNQLVVYGGKHFLHGSFQAVQGYEILVSAHAGDQDAGVSRITEA